MTELSSQEQLAARSYGGEGSIRWQEEMFIYSCFLYEEGHDTVLSDSNYDQLCQFILRWYNDTTPEFRERVDESRLVTGTAAGLVYTEEEKQKAFEWRKRIKEVKEEMKQRLAGSAATALL